MSLSSLKTLKLETLLGMEGLHIISFEKWFGLTYSGGISLEAMPCKIYAPAFCNLGIGLILNARKWEVNSCIRSDNVLSG